jgi:hypothetical protein
MEEKAIFCATSRKKPVASTPSTPAGALTSLARREQE